MPVGTLTSKGQITLPKEVRDRLGLEPGSRVDFVIEPSGRVMLRPMSQDFRSLRGIVKSRNKRRVSLREMDEAIARGFSGS
jgi:AbrB family looped-hinge helix DNA binding protein